MRASPLKPGACRQACGGQRLHPQQFAFCCTEFFFGQDAGVPELRELVDLADQVVPGRFGGRLRLAERLLILRRRRLIHRLRLRFRLLICGLLVRSGLLICLLLLLVPVDRPRSRCCRARHYGSSGHRAQESWPPTSSKHRCTPSPSVDRTNVLTDRVRRVRIIPRPGPAAQIIAALAGGASPELGDRAGR